MNEKQEIMWATLAELTGEQVLCALTDWHGMQLLTDAFYANLVAEGYIEEGELL